MATKRERVAIMLVRTPLTQKEIAKEVGVHETTICKWKKKDDFNKLVREEQDKFLKDLSAPAIRTINALLDSHSDYVRLQAAQDILDRTGYKPTENINMDSTETVMIVDDIK